MGKKTNFAFEQQDVSYRREQRISVLFEAIFN
jgi:hypothetical protein